MKRYIGIDNGLSGGLAMITLHNNGRKEISVIDMPTISIPTSKGKRQEYDIYQIREFFFCEGKKIKPSAIILELATARPGQGVVSMFRTGYGLGLIEGLLCGLKLPYEVVTPQKWKKHFSLMLKGKKEKKEIKQFTYSKAKKLFPSAELTGKNGGIKDGRCDAIMMAEYGRQVYS